jgi:ATP-dependent RNA helicase RhlE
MKFSELNLHHDLMEALDSMGFSEATPIQEQSIPDLINGRDIIGCAQTGTGKTAAFLIPLIERILKSDRDGVKGIIIAPTRELAIQIDRQMEGLSYFCGIGSIAIYGGKDGMSWEQEKTALSQGGADVIICTPGRLIAHLGFNYADFSKVEVVILDEADRMLDMGFHDDIMKIVETVPPSRQTMMFSATMPPKIRTLAEKLLKDPLSISIAISKPSENIRQEAYMVYDTQKELLIEKLLEGQDITSCIVFVSTKKNVRSIERRLSKKGWKAASISSDLEQKEREDVLNDFRNRRINYLVATDILSRGIDIDEIQVVVNYEVPRDPEDYVHRIGRTARAGASGRAITFVNEMDMQAFARCEKLIERSIEKPPLPDGMEGPVYDPKRSRFAPSSEPAGRRGAGGGGRAGGGRGNGPRRDRPSAAPNGQGPKAEASGQGSPDGPKKKRKNKKRRGPRPEMPSGGGQGS